MLHLNFTNIFIKISILYKIQHFRTHFEARKCGNKKSTDTFGVPKNNKDKTNK